MHLTHVSTTPSTLPHLIHLRFLVLHLFRPPASACLPNTFVRKAPSLHSHTFHPNPIVFKQTACRSASARIFVSSGSTRGDRRARSVKVTFLSLQLVCTAKIGRVSVTVIAHDSIQSDFHPFVSSLDRVAFDIFARLRFSAAASSSLLLLLLLLRNSFEPVPVCKFHGTSFTWRSPFSHPFLFLSFSKFISLADVNLSSLSFSNPLRALLALPSPSVRLPNTFEI